MKKTFLRAFSLVELMVTLVVVSILTAAMAPVITKRLKSKEITIAQGGGGLTMNCASISPQCGLCEGNVCVSCAKSCTENEALDIPNCTCKACNSDDFHGEACLRCDMENCSKCVNGYYLASGNCELCTDGYTCDGTNQNPCPVGYYCKNGTTTACSAGTYNDTQGATSSSSCKVCSLKTENCTNCDIATGVCNTCASGYEIAGGSCNASVFSYNLTVSNYSETESSDGKQKIYLRSNGTFTPKNTKKGTLFIVGGGGGGGNPAGYCGSNPGGGGGGGGYINKTSFTFQANTTYNVTIGAGGAATKTGGTSSFGNVSSYGGAPGGGGSGGAGGSAGGNYQNAGKIGTAFDGEYFGGGGSGGAGYWIFTPLAAPKGGGGHGGISEGNGGNGTANTGGGGGGSGYHCDGTHYGGSGGSGVIIILI